MLSVKPALVCAPNPLLTLDEFFDSVSYRNVEVSPDGLAVVVEVVRADWQENRFRHDLWLYRHASSGKGSLTQLTRSGYERNPQWSPDSRWIAFVSDPPAPRGETGQHVDSRGRRRATSPQLGVSGPAIFLISMDGGEPLRLTEDGQEPHAFAWSKDSRSIYFAGPVPVPDRQQAAYGLEWKDVIRLRESEREDLIYALDFSAALKSSAQSAGRSAATGVRAQVLSRTPYRVKELAASSDGRHVAFATEPRSRRQESLFPYSIYLLDLPGGQVKLLSHTQAIYEHIHWAPNNRNVFFSVKRGSVEGSYQDVQPRVYTVDMIGKFTNEGGPTTRWASKFTGAITDYAVTSTGALLSAGTLGTEVQLYTQTGPATELVKRSGWSGTYQHLSASQGSLRLAFVYSSLGKPAEVYLADNPDCVDRAVPITAFNRRFAERALPEGKPYHWTTDDGVTAEGMLIYPPGRVGAEHLPMLTLIHDGPEDADGNSFGADWLRWSALAAANGWFVFEPNYRGSIGYGDAFTLGRVPHVASRPGKDILQGIDALVKEGTADPDHLVIGGYGYGGTLTNWLIAQTTRFKAALSGAGRIEHVGQWGKDETSFDDAYSLGGMPWEAERNYNDEAPIWQFGKVKTPTHIVTGANDTTTMPIESYLLERALHTRDIAATLLVFPGEGHELDQNPWHGKIKVREELKWLQRYGR
jgi:dipeptidyl aminopeptidase/acylaminoacyl peptidase